MSRSKCTTGEAAAAVKITRATLQAWIARDKVKAPEPIIRDGRAVRLWSTADIEHLREARKRFYHKGGGRPTQTVKKTAKS